MKSAHDVILGPLVTEKLGVVAERSNVVALRVAPRANKIEIKRAVEQVWKVKVDDVRTMNMRGKLKRLGRFAGRRPNWKKAYVTLAEGERIPDLS